MRSTIIYVPGIKPKPPAAQHHAALWRCLVEGVRRADPATARNLAGQPESFRLVSWAHVFYSEQRDISLDEPGIRRLFRLNGPEAGDVREASSFSRRFTQRLYLLSDAFPPLMKLVGREEMRITLRDTSRYLSNEDGVAVNVRRMVADAVIEAWNAGERVLLIGHSLGSVIAWDALWELSYRFSIPQRVDLFLTIGSPLGLQFVRSRLLGAREPGPRRYPRNIRRWRNLAAVGETTALDRSMSGIYAEMKTLGMVEELSDRLDLQTYFRGPDGLNVHKCYGYLVNAVTGGVVAGWWREAAGDLTEFPELAPGSS